MKIRYDRPVSVAATWSYRFGLFAFALFAISAGLHRFGFMQSDVFAALFVLCAGFAALAFLLACHGMLRLWMVGARGGRASTKACLLSICVLIPAGIVGFRAVTLPQLYEVSTNTDDVPEFLNPVSRPINWTTGFEVENAQPYDGQAEAYPQVTGRRYEGALDRVLEAVRLVADNSGIRIIATKLPEPVVLEPEPSDENALPVDENALPVDETPSVSIIETADNEDLPLDPDDENPEVVEEIVEPIIIVPVQAILQGEGRSVITGFASDISIRLSEEAETTFVDMRSVSRFGPHDLGANADIISTFLTALDAELVGISVR